MFDELYRGAYFLQRVFVTRYIRSVCEFYGGAHVLQRVLLQEEAIQAGSWFPPLQSKVLTPTTTRRWPAVGGQKTGPGRVARVAPRGAERS